MKYTPKRHIRLPDDDSPLWVFGYGSLMWNPGFDHEKRSGARVFGLHRRLCVSSIRYRGTRDRPGLVLGLDRGGSCRGCALLVHATRKHEVAAYLEEREMLNEVYKPVFVNAEIDGHGRCPVLTFRVRRDHPQYNRHMQPVEIARRVGSCEGSGGANRDYVINTWRALEQLGVCDPELSRVAELLYDATPHERVIAGIGSVRNSDTNR